MSALFSLLWLFVLGPVSGPTAPAEDALEATLAHALVHGVHAEVWGHESLAALPEGAGHEECANRFLKVESADPDEKCARGYFELPALVALTPDDSGARALRWWKGSALRSQALVRVHAARGPPAA